MKPINYITIVLVIVSAVLIGYVFIRAPSQKTIAEDSSEIFNDMDQLHLYVDEYGPASAVKQLKRLEPEYGDCTGEAYEVGRYTVEKTGSVPEALEICSDECRTGCRSGIIGYYFTGVAPEDYVEEVYRQCIESNLLRRNYCVSLSSQGLLPTLDYDITAALSYCDMLDEELRNPCAYGVFWEDATGQFSHGNYEYNEDVDYPCSISPEKYLIPCYDTQGTRLYRHIRNAKEVADYCWNLPEPYEVTHFYCYRGLGRALADEYYDEPEKILKGCGYAPTEFLTGCCLARAPDRIFYERSSKEKALNFCKSLESQYKQACYWKLQRSAYFILGEEEAMEFCHEYEEDYQESCLNKDAIY